MRHRQADGLYPLRRRHDRAGPCAPRFWRISGPCAAATRAPCLATRYFCNRGLEQPTSTMRQLALVVRCESVNPGHRLCGVSPCLQEVIKRLGRDVLAIRANEDGAQPVDASAGTAVGPGFGGRPDGN